MGSVRTLKRVVPRGPWPYLGGERRRARSLPPRTRRQKQRRLARGWDDHQDVYGFVREG